MESAKLKNIILTILLITNALLLGLTTVQHMRSSQYHQQALLDAVELLAQRGIAADVRDLPRTDFPAPQVLEPDPQEEVAAFTALLGEGTTPTQRGLVTLYVGPLGTAELREDGAFSVTFKEGSYPLAGQDMDSYALDVLERMGFSARVTETGQDTIGAVQMLGEVPVFSCAATLRYQEGQLRSISGVRLMGRATAAPQEEAVLSIATLLVRFRAAIINSGDACNAIRTATQGYILSSDASHDLRLIPVLQLETDTNLYFLNAVTGELSRG